ncbi:SelT-like protein [Lucilia cuprina]|uniref:SelT-like protein n=1 Tax=Lucilia cuprina TaxID=7375 RepID=A0A0L0C8X0_LUCCU|nr:thioredoxin reductase-like selenoprotein T homolog CG3887 [Lucilia cuprina]XP_037810006.1 thioredoxin reductase-like selenoprotein T homolog CG3887 [Lucilia sericata]KAI8125692.1 SelT-like protein [Lucilia cuprina]KNC28687.1 SelT-like protein [Lucilia cuprina]
MGLLGGRNISLAFCICIAFVLIGSINVEAEKEIPTTKFGQNVGGPTMTFLYCYSCGYRKAFEDYVNILSEKYPQISVTGGNYDPPGMNMYFSKLIFAVKILLIVVIVSSFDIFGAIGQATPSWWRHLLDNKLYACMMIFFVGNMLEGQLVSSGAFEISLNDVPVWSKLQTGRIPAPQELFQIIDNQLQFGDKIQENPEFVK